jgi:hypothetical protein
MGAGSRAARISAVLQAWTNSLDRISRSTNADAQRHFHAVPWCSGSVCLLSATTLGLGAWCRTVATLHLPIALVCTQDGQPRQISGTRQLLPPQWLRWLCDGRCEHPADTRFKQLPSQILEGVWPLHHWRDQNGEKICLIPFVRRSSRASACVYGNTD